MSLAFGGIVHMRSQSQGDVFAISTWQGNEKRNEKKGKAPIVPKENVLEVQNER